MCVCVCVWGGGYIYTPIQYPRAKNPRVGTYGCSPMRRGREGSLVFWRSITNRDPPVRSMTPLTAERQRAAAHRSRQNYSPNTLRVRFPPTRLSKSQALSHSCHIAALHSTSACRLQFWKLSVWRAQAYGY